MNIRWAASLISIISIVLTQPGCTSRKKAAQLGQIERRDLLQQVTVGGNIAPNRRGAISAPFSGYINKIYVKLGDKVRKGDPIVSFTQSLTRFEEEVFPLRSPFSGRVVQVLRSEGEFIEASGSSNTPVVRIDDLSRYFVVADVPEVDFAKIKQGQEGVVRAAAIIGKTYKGVIREMSGASNEGRDRWSRSDNVEFSVKMEVLDADEQLLPGMSVIIDIITGKRENALTLKHEFVLKKEGSFYVILENGTQQKIQVGLQNEDAFEVVAGLNEGQKVRQVDFSSMSL